MNDNKGTSQEDIIIKSNDNNKDTIKGKTKELLDKVSNFIKN
jgi:hypothetical protein